MEEANFKTVPAAFVTESDADPVFIEFLNGIANDEDPLIQIQ